METLEINLYLCVRLQEVQLRGVVEPIYRGLAKPNGSFHPSFVLSILYGRSQHTAALHYAPRCIRRVSLFVSQERMAEARDLFRNKESTEFIIVTIPTVMAAAGGGGGTRCIPCVRGYSMWGYNCTHS